MECPICKKASKPDEKGKCIHCGARMDARLKRASERFLSILGKEKESGSLPSQRQRR